MYTKQNPSDSTYGPNPAHAIAAPLATRHSAALASCQPWTWSARAAGVASSWRNDQTSSDFIQQLPHGAGVVLVHMCHRINDVRATYYWTVSWSLHKYSI